MVIASKFHRFAFPTTVLKPQWHSKTDQQNFGDDDLSFVVLHVKDMYKGTMDKQFLEVDSLPF